MKKTKLLLASPVLIAPFIATIPFTTTSCHKYKTDFGKLEEYVDHEIVSDGSSAFVHLSVKSDQKDRYLPNQLNSVSTNGRKLTPIETTNGREGYYTYTLLDNNKTAILYIFDYQGNIQIDAETATLKSISAEGYDITGSGVAEFEVGEYLNSETTSKRITITATLSNGDQIDLDHDDVTFTLGSHKIGTKFINPEEKTVGTVTFQDKTDTFEYQVNKKTTAYYSYTNSTSWKTTINKYTEQDGWKKAIAAYNSKTATAENNGYYVIGLPDGKYALDENIEIKQKNNQTLLLEAVGEVTFDESQFIYPVEFNADDTHTFSIVGDTTATETEVGISGIKFTNNKENAKLVTLTTNAHDVLFDDCGFYNSDSSKTGVCGIYCDAADVNNAAQAITILDCTGQYLNTLLGGWICHDDYSPYDLIISNSSIWNSNKLFDIVSSKIDAYIYNVYAQIMGEDTPKSSMVIAGTGNYSFIDSEFVQTKTAKSDIGFVELQNGNGLDDRTLTFFHCSLVRTGEEKLLNDVINKCGEGLPGVDWTISWTGFDDETETGMVYAKPTAEGQKTTWSHK